MSGKTVGILAIFLGSGLYLYSRSGTNTPAKTPGGGGGNNPNPNPPFIQPTPTTPQTQVPGGPGDTNPQNANDYLDYYAGNVQLRIISIDTLQQCISFAFNVNNVQVFADTWCANDGPYTVNAGSGYQVQANPDGYGNVVLTLFDSSSNILLMQSVIIPGYIGLGS